ncbi:MAG: hypothetical protein CMI90_02355 [Pelagibacteraceae bacterium]|nr:hypothetical protein [Pelagibacteraceae bacterium]
MIFFKNLSSIEKKILYGFIASIFIFIFFDTKLTLFFYGLNDPFKSFFHAITNFGNSLYYFCITIILFFVFRVKKDTSTLFKNIYDLNLFTFYNLILSGIVVQLLKHIIGRPRPKMLMLDHNSLDLNLFTFNSSFHSFPSGHTATIFSVVFVLYFIFPRVKKFILSFGIIVGLTRFIIGAHHFTDVIAGCGVSFFVFIFLRNKFLDQDRLFTKNNNKIIPNEGIQDLTLKIKKIFNDYQEKLIQTHYYYKYFLLIIIISIAFFIFPTIDITVSGIFYRGSGQFFANSTDWNVYILREIILKIIVIALFLLPLISSVHLAFTKKRLLNLSLNNCAYLFLSSILSLGIVVNIILKNLWGRVRPNDTVIFGGDQPFSIPWLKVSHCDHNCSFVSGDVSAYTLLLALILVFDKKHLTKFAYLLIFLIGLTRIMEGGHFFSDVIMSFMITHFILKILFDLFSRLPDNLNVDKIYILKKK